MDLVSTPLAAEPCQGGGMIVLVQKTKIILITVALKAELVKWKERTRRMRNWEQKPPETGLSLN